MWGGAALSAEHTPGSHIPPLHVGHSETSVTLEPRRRVRFGAPRDGVGYAAIVLLALGTMGWQGCVGAGVLCTAETVVFGWSAESPKPLPFPLPVDAAPRFVAKGRPQGAPRTTAVGYPPTAFGYSPTAAGHYPKAVGCHPNMSGGSTRPLSLCFVSGREGAPCPCPGPGLCPSPGLCTQPPMPQVVYESSRSACHLRSENATLEVVSASGSKVWLLTPTQRQCKGGVVVEGGAYQFCRQVRPIPSGPAREGPHGDGLSHVFGWQLRNFPQFRRFLFEETPSHQCRSAAS